MIGILPGTEELHQTQGASLRAAPAERWGQHRLIGGWRAPAPATKISTQPRPEPLTSKDSSMPRLINALGLGAAALVIAPAALLAVAPAASAGQTDFGGGAGDRPSSTFSPTAANCEGLQGYLRSHGGVLKNMSNTFQTEWRQCAAGALAGSFGKG
jgi:hypothetical protein